MRSNENMNWMRNHIFNVAERNNTTQRRLQEVRNERLFGTEPTYTVADLMEDVSQMNQHQFDWFVDAMGAYNRVRFENIFEQFQEMVECVADYRDQGMYLFESVQDTDVDVLIEAQADNIQKMISAYQNRLKTMPADSPQAKALKQRINAAQDQIGRLRAAGERGRDVAAAKKASTGVSASGKPKFGDVEQAKKYMSAASALETARRKVAQGQSAAGKQKPQVKPEESGKYEKMADASREARAAAPEKKSIWQQFQDDRRKHTGLMLGDAGAGLKYYAKRAGEIGKGTAKAVGRGTVGAAKLAGKGVVGGAKLADKAISTVGQAGIKGAAHTIGTGIAAGKLAGRAGGGLLSRIKNAFKK